MRCWLGSGLHTKRLHPDLSVYNLGSLGANGKASGPSNLFTDLVFYLLTNDMGGAGALLKMTESNTPLLEVSDFVAPLVSCTHKSSFSTVCLEIELICANTLRTQRLTSCATL